MEPDIRVVPSGKHGFGVSVDGVVWSWSEKEYDAGKRAAFLISIWPMIDGMYQQAIDSHIAATWMRAFGDMKLTLHGLLWKVDTQERKVLKK
jgi:hypothetical protein